VKIPAQPEVAPPLKARAQTFEATDRYGMVWVRLAHTPFASASDLPTFAFGDNPEFRTMQAGPYRFRALRPRLIENFFDVAHLGIVHAGLLGDPVRLSIEEYDVAMTEHGPEASSIRIWQPDPDGTGQPALVNYRYWASGPLTAGLEKMLGRSVLHGLVSAAYAQGGVVGSSGGTFDCLPVPWFCVLMNGLGTILAALLGSPFPTTLYLGHAAHKANGARAGYSVLNGVVSAALCCTGVLPIVVRVIPLEVTAPVIVWFGPVTVGQAFAEVPKTEALAVALGLLPALAQWATALADTIARKAGTSLYALAPRMGDDLALGGLIALGQGSLLTSML